MKRRRRTRGTFEQTAAPLLFLSPNLLIFSLFIIVPAVMGLRMSLFDWSILDGSRFVGFRNFVRLARDAMFWKTLLNTFVYVGAVVPLLVAFALGLAVLLARPGRAMGVFRSLFYLPTLLSLIIVGIAWRWILGFDLGILNYIIRALGGKAVPWLTNGRLAMSSLIFMTLWTRVGYFMMMLVGGLQAIPETYYEADRIDGAGRVATFRRITLPLLRPMLLVVAVLATIESFKAYELIFVTTQGGPGSATKFLVQYIYEVAFEQDRMGYGAAMSVVLMAIIAVFTFAQFVARREEFGNE